ncbi:TPA: conjugal transfer protein TraD [Legionella pneumophila]|nr:conjugal transfer protein TraD [Legionella pneumophila]HDS3863208.1 conjugal transfer protein TraD [Legionella pneumophila]
MPTSQLIKKEQQKISRLEKELSLEKLKKRRADTRRKIEYGGLVIKSAMDAYNKSVILGALDHACRLINEDEKYIAIFESVGDTLFLEK